MLRRTIYTLIILLLILVLVGVAQAQSSGAIRGTVYSDTNSDGVCVGTGEPVLAGVPIQLVTADGQTVVNLESGSDGTYGMVAAGFGTWNVTALPGPAGNHRRRFLCGPGYDIVWRHGNSFTRVWRWPFIEPTRRGCCRPGLHHDRRWS
jgi:hypothetical protein